METLRGHQLHRPVTIVKLTVTSGNELNKVDVEGHASTSIDRDVQDADLVLRVAHYVLVVLCGSFLYVMGHILNPHDVSEAQKAMTFSFLVSFLVSFSVSFLVSFLVSQLFSQPSSQSAF